MSERFSLSSSSSRLTIGVSVAASCSDDGCGVAAGLAGPNNPPNGLEDGLRPKRPEPVVVGPDVWRPNFCGAGVVVGVVDSMLKMDRGFVSTLAGVATSMSSSLAPSVLGAGFDESPSESPKPESNREPPPSGFGSSLSLAVLGSALKVVPRTKGDEPKVDPPWGFEVGTGKDVSESIETSGALGGADPDGFPNMLCEVLFAPRDANPVLLAKPANPPLACCEPVVALPKTLP